MAELTSQSHEMRDSIITVCLIILSVIGVTVALIYLKSVLIPFVFSVFFYFMIVPLVDFFECRFHMPRYLTITLVLILLVLMFIGLSSLLGASLTTFIYGSSEYQDKLIAVVDEMDQFAMTHGVEINLSVIREYIANLPILKWVGSISTSVVNVVGNFVLVLIYTFFMLSGKKTEEQKEKERRSQQKEGGLLNDKVEQNIRRYLATKFFTSLLTGLLVMITLTIFDVQLAFMFGVLTFFLNFIPNIGSIIAVLLPIPVLLLQFGYGWSFILIMSITGLIQFAIGNILDPKLMGLSLGIHPAAVLLSLLFWGYIWGVPGMFLSIPMTAVIKLVLNRHPTTQPLAGLLEGRLMLPTRKA